MSSFAVTVIQPLPFPVYIYLDIWCFLYYFLSNTVASMRINVEGREQKDSWAFPASWPSVIE